MQVSSGHQVQLYNLYMTAIMRVQCHCSQLLSLLLKAALATYLQQHSLDQTLQVEPYWFAVC